MTQLAKIVFVLYRVLPPWQIDIAQTIYMRICSLRKLIARPKLISGSFLSLQGETTERTTFFDIQMVSKSLRSPSVDRHIDLFSRIFEHFRSGQKSRDKFVADWAVVLWMPHEVLTKTRKLLNSKILFLDHENASSYL